MRCYTVADSPLYKRQWLAVVFDQYLHGEFYEKYINGFWGGLFGWLGNVRGHVVIHTLWNHPIVKCKPAWFRFAPLDVPTYCMGWLMGPFIFIANFFQQFICPQFCHSPDSYPDPALCVLSFLRR